MLPLVFASGAGFEIRRAVGIAVFAGMIGVTTFGLFLTPVFYAFIGNLTERLRRRGQPIPAARLRGESSDGVYVLLFRTNQRLAGPR